MSKARVERAAAKAGVTVTVESRQPYDWAVCLRAPRGQRFDASEAHVAIESGDTAAEMWRGAAITLAGGMYPCTSQDDCECVPANKVQ
jgi:hypothetical protein